MVAAGTMMSQSARAAGGEIHSFHSPALELDAPSMVAWRGSLGALELHHQLSSGAAGVKASSPILLFDLPTMSAAIVAAGGMSPVPLTSFASSKSLELPVRCPQPSRPSRPLTSVQPPRPVRAPPRPPLSGDDACAVLTLISAAPALRVT